MGTLGASVSALEGDEFPACFPDTTGQVFLRGHVTLSPVPAVGGGLLAVLPLDPDGSCSCTPEEKDVILTTTALAFPMDLEGSADVCIVRLLVDEYVYADVNRDLVIDALDVNIVETSDLYSISPNASSKCTEAMPCGALDVNRDGKVNQLDSTSITQSARLGTNVSCGGVYATAFSCGSTRRAPITPAVAISFDGLSYFSDDGLLVDPLPFQNFFPPSIGLGKRRGASSVIDSVLVEFDRVNAHVRDLQAQLEQQGQSTSERLDVLQATTEELQQSEQHMKRAMQQGNHGRGTIWVDIVLSGVAVLACAALVTVLARRNK